MKTAACPHRHTQPALASRPWPASYGYKGWAYAVLIQLGAIVLVCAGGLEVGTVTLDTFSTALMCGLVLRSPPCTIPHRIQFQVAQAGSSFRDHT